MEQRATKPLPLVAQVDCQSGKEHRRHRPLFRLSPQCSRVRLLRPQLGSGERVVADDPLAVGRNEDSRRAGSLGLERMVSQPLVQLRLATAAARPAMLIAQKTRT